MVSTVVVQQRQRLFREGLGQLLAAEDDIDVVGTASSADELFAVCQEHSPDLVLIEASSTEWDIPRLVAPPAAAAPQARRHRPDRLRRHRPPRSPRARRAGMAALVSRPGGIADILARPYRTSCPPRAVRPCRPPAIRPASTDASVALTERELDILKLVGAGLTSREISGRLVISHKTVENHKQRIFAKLGVQNQAHAVSVAMRTGLMRPERIIDLALAD